MKNGKRHIRCSSLDILPDCPGFQRLAWEVTERDHQAGAEVRKPNQGTEVHKAIEKLLIGDNVTEVGEPETNKDFWAFWTWWAKCLPELLCNFFGDKRGNLSTEIEASYVYDWGKFLLTGHPDLIYRSKKQNSAIIIDWKYYQYPQFPSMEEHLQMLGYATLLYMTNRATRIQIVRVLVKQQVISTATFEIEDLQNIAQRIFQTCTRVVDEWDYLITGPHCANCFQRSNCPEFEGEVNNLVPYRKGVVVNQSNAGKIWIACKALENLLGQAKDAVKKFIELGGKVELDGKELVTSYHSREFVADTVNAIRELRNVCGNDAVDGSLKLTKSAVKKACEEMGANPEAVWETMRHDGYIGETLVERTSWKKIKEKG